MKNRLRLSLVIAGGCLLLAIAPIDSYQFYMLLRLIVAGVALFAIFRSASLSRHTWFLGFIALLYNPILPIYLTKEVWTPINLIVAFYFFYLSKRDYDRRASKSAPPPVKRPPLEGEPAEGAAPSQHTENSKNTWETPFVLLTIAIAVVVIATMITAISRQVKESRRTPTQYTVDRTISPPQASTAKTLVQVFDTYCVQNRNTLANVDQLLIAAGGEIISKPGDATDEAETRLRIAVNGQYFFISYAQGVACKSAVNWVRPESVRQALKNSYSVQLLATDSTSVTDSEATISELYSLTSASPVQGHMILLSYQRKGQGGFRWAGIYLLFPEPSEAHSRSRERPESHLENKCIDASTGTDICETARRQADEMSKALPMQLSPNMSLESVAASDSAIIQNIRFSYDRMTLMHAYRIAGVSLETAKDTMTTQAKSTLCYKDAPARSFIALGGRVVINYSFITGEFFLTVEVDSCD